MGRNFVVYTVQYAGIKQVALFGFEKYKVIVKE